MSRVEPDKTPVPVIGCFVSHADKDSLGVVIGQRSMGGESSVEVRWGSDSGSECHPVSELRNGFRIGHVVQDRPRSNIRKTLGTGTVRATRSLAGRDMVLAQLHTTGESRWLPYENLVRLRDARIRYERAETADSDSGERFRLKVLAYALESWNQVTGSLDRLDVDPLPHQIDLVHRIMTSDQSNWLIADDVGLGKTIEVGLLLAAMKRRRHLRRVLVVCPAGVVRQWQDEMRYKFNEDFRIYGVDFNVNQPSHWMSFDQVIVSVDKAKTEANSHVFGESGDWDVIVFDEAHHLSKITGQGVTQRYQLAEQLQGMTDTLLFLTGTPHQGRTDQFVNLLLLLRPDLDRRFLNAFTEPSVVGEVVLRNRKSLVTDANGRFIFRGQDTRLIATPLSEPARMFDMQLREYLRHGYDASAAGGPLGRAVGFVMTTYRKLAASSIAAIELALQRRMARLKGSAGVGAAPAASDQFLEDFTDSFLEGTDGLDDLEEVSDDVAAASAGASPFFHNEEAYIVGLLETSNEVKGDDLKLKQFLSEIVDPLYDNGERLLVFTEYRATQSYIVEALRDRYQACVVTQINGDMSLNEKRRSVDEFNNKGTFMVSTEAGGEGINLHQRCHILVNYDLPWNPRRLVQRAGRLYRYGQEERVMVFNLMANDGFDSQALNMMMERIYNIARDMADVGSEFEREGLQTEIVGDLLERVDMATILANNRNMDISHTEGEIEEAISRARVAKSQQEMLFSQIESYDPDAASALYTFGQEDVLSFLEGILPYKGVKIRDRLYNGRVLELELPDGLRGAYSEFPGRAMVVRVTADRQIAMSNSRIAPMDFASVFFADLVDYAKSPEFRGEYAHIAGPLQGSIALYKLRWQNDQGSSRWESLLPVFLGAELGRPASSPEFFASILRAPAESTCLPDTLIPTDRRQRLNILDQCADEELAVHCTERRLPSDIVLLATADLGSPEMQR